MNKVVEIEAEKKDKYSLLLLLLMMMIGGGG